LGKGNGRRIVLEVRMMYLGDVKKGECGMGGLRHCSSVRSRRTGRRFASAWLSDSGGKNYGSQRSTTSNKRMRKRKKVIPPRKGKVQNGGSQRSNLCKKKRALAKGERELRFYYPSPRERP